MTTRVPSNYTSLIDDIEHLATPSNSTSLMSSEDGVELVTDSPFPSPADPFEDYVNVTDYTIVEVKNGKNGTESVTVFEFLNMEPWVVYTVCGVAAVAVILAIIGLVVWLKKHKTRVINETTDPTLATNFPDNDGIFSCCCKSKPKISMDHRQNSSSNLEFYGRPALPQSAYQTERPKSADSMAISTSNMAMYIDEIEGIPSREIPQSQRRELPKFRYQQYQMQS
ncbi:hypothetical protein CRE_21192 [Caenorhabditis remanei]|uniref:Uncharacterized protein n=2 Tax=Caenorhabditis remanei TaxID=31234 RepID=E3MES8_CAERE|nr:hypothetical protein CRE_21192 [Caenorhabditis remanei]